MTLTDLTPIENHRDIWYKRDDLFIPFADCPINGGKVRQFMALVKENLNHIVENCNSTIGMYASVYSPQSLRMARIAKEYGLKSILAIGNYKPLDFVLNRHRNLKIDKKR